ncbi:hypothetical protein INR49_029826 [Caranx melampygus]|nr:hypothetical protein INR49_029826 [Caranx melampygus]
MLGNVGNSSHIPRTLPAWLIWSHRGHDPATVEGDFGCRRFDTKGLQDEPECIFICVSELSLQKRQCAFQLNGTTNIQQTYKFMAAGNVSGSVQVCENTQCCVGYYQIISGQPEVDILEENVQAHLLCSCQTTKNSKIDIDDIELQQIVGRGDFATVLQGKYQGSTVAVKVFPADWKCKFTAEKEVYELPLMRHAGILHFLGTGRKPEGSCFIVSQFAEHGSLHSFLCERTTSWTLSLKLCQSLSQGLSYLHSDLRRYGRHIWQSNMIVRKSGTLRYMSPEFLEGCANISSSCCLMQGDVYALGLLLWEIWMRCSDLSEGSITPQHLLPYESELGGNITLESLISYVSKMDKRPSVPPHWELLPQGSALQELLTDCWDCDPDARLTAQCAADRLVSLQSCFS